VPLLVCGALLEAGEKGMHKVGIKLLHLGKFLIA
jgi:hypothetical protein